MVGAEQKGAEDTDKSEDFSMKVEATQEAVYPDVVVESKSIDVMDDLLSINIPRGNEII